MQKAKRLHNGTALGVIHEEGKHKGTVPKKHGKKNFARFRTDNRIKLHYIRIGMIFKILQKISVGSAKEIFPG